MSKRKKVNWKDLSRFFSVSSEEAEIARSLFVSYEKNGYLERDDLSPQKVSKATIVDFYNRLAMMRTSESPVRRKKKPDWMESRDFARFNHRELNDIETHPLFLQLSILPSIRSSALILSPFTSNRKGELNTVDSHSSICELFCDSQLTSMGFSPDIQFHLFIDAIHLLGKCVGYTLDYRMDRFAVAVMRRPELFRWIDRNCNLPYREMLVEDNQKIIHDKINQQVKTFLFELGGVPSAGDYERLRNRLKESGFWTVPSCLDGAEQLPFLHPDENESSPRFNGAVESLTSFKFHLSMNEEESLRPVRQQNEVAVDYYSSLYRKWRDSFSFDLIKFGGIDFIDEEQKRSADCPDLSIVSKVIKRIRSGNSHTGVIGSVSNGTDHYSTAGLNVLFREAGEEDLNRAYMDGFFRSSRFHTGLIAALPVRLDNSDSLRRLFLSRFSSTAKRLITKYEIHRNGSALYHRIENVHTRYGELMKKGELEGFYVDEFVTWWIIKSGNHLLIPVISLDNQENSVPSQIYIDYSKVNRSSRVLSVLEYDFNSSSGNLFLCGDDSILCENLPYKGFRLYSVQ